MPLFERYQFLEFFETEKIINIDELIDDIKYTLQLNDDLNFIFHTITCEEHSCISVYSKNQQSHLFQIELKHLRKITIKDGSLYFFKETYRDRTLDEATQEPLLVIRVKPHFYFEYLL